ncbi:MAG: di-heme oxidoredictase family protein [Myxococcota bacterium]
MKIIFNKLLGLALPGLVACGGDVRPLEVVREDALDRPLAHSSAAERARFAEGDTGFGRLFREADGLGPLYIRSSCEACHDKGSKGPGLVEKVALVDADGRTPARDQSALRFGHTLRPYTAAGASAPIAAPSTSTQGLVLLTRRVGPSVLGRGYLEAIDDAEIERGMAEQATRSDGVHGRINRVVFHSEANPDTRFHQHQRGQANLIGRFGLKARIRSLDDFTADAFQGDMGMTSPLRPEEPPNPDAQTDDAHPGLDLTADDVNRVADYLRLLEIPARDAEAEAGRAAFLAADCGVCHAPSLRTRPDYPISALAGIEAPVFTDLLLHEMGEAFADGLADESARSSEWRTAPLIGLRFQKTFLHDGRATSIEAAILAHDSPGSEAAASVQKYRNLSPADQALLIRFVSTR